MESMGRLDRMRHMWWLAAWGLPWLMAAAAGCSDPAYALYAVRGQLHLVSRTRPIDWVLASGSLTEEQRAKIALIQDVRDFAAEIGLNVAGSYTTFLDTGGEPVAYNLSASAKDSFTPYTWTFPFAAEIPYLGFFGFEEARRYQENLVARGYDTVLYPVASYSTLGVFPDPITSAMLEYTETYLVDLVIHEVTHNTIWRENDTDFNENVATFVAEAGAVAYLTRENGADSDVVRRVLDEYNDADVYNEFLADLYARMSDYYASDLSREEKIEGRSALFAEAKQRFRDEYLPRMHRPEDYDWVETLNINNAWILLNARYNADLSAFEAVYEFTDRDFGATLQIFRQAASSNDPIGYLQDAVK